VSQPQVEQGLLGRSASKDSSGLRNHATPRVLRTARVILTVLRRALPGGSEARYERKAGSRMSSDASLVNDIVWWLLAVTLIAVDVVLLVFIAGLCWLMQARVREWKRSSKSSS